MTNTKIIEDLTNWVDENICSKVTLKKPTDSSVGGQVQYVKPAAFALFVPAKDRLPPNVAAPCPSICVQVMEAKDRMIEHKRLMKIRLAISCWNPGTQSGEIFVPHAVEDAPFGVAFSQGTEPASYARNLDGWKDIWNLMDVALREIEGTEFFAGCRLIKEQDIEFGPFVEEGAIWDYYPYWNSWISFNIEAGLVTKTPKSYQDLL